MTQVTVRNIEDEWVAKAKAEAAARKVSMNSVLKEAIGRGLGVELGRTTNGLEKFAGSMSFDSKEEEARWDKFISDDLNEIHPDDWK